MGQMESEIDLLQVEKRIRTRVKKQMEKSQREYYLNEQMKAIQKELGETEDGVDEFEVLKQKIEESKMPAEAREKTEQELHDLAKAEEILNADHYGLERVKERILEYLAVQSRISKLKGPILC